MAQQPEVVKQSELLNQFVLDRSTMAELGQVEVLWMYPKVHRVLGFICKSGWLGQKKTAFNLDQLHTIGNNGILVNSRPVDTDVEKVRQLETLVSWEVWTDAGNKAGKIIDYLFNLRTGVIEHYLFTASDWSGITGSAYLLPSSYVLKLGNRRVLVSEEAIRSFTLYREGIQEKLTKMTGFLQDEKSQVTQELRSLFTQAKAATGTARERAQILAEQAREKAQSLAEQVREKTYDVVERWDELEVTIEPPDEPDPLEDWDDEDFVQPTVDVQAQPVKDKESHKLIADKAVLPNNWDDEESIDLPAKPPELKDKDLEDDDDPWI